MSSNTDKPMTWRDGVTYWQEWAKLPDAATDIMEDIPRMARFYAALETCIDLDLDMPADLVRGLGMDKP